MTSPLTVLYEDPHLLAVAKPAGLLTQGRPEAPTLEADVRAYLNPDDPAGVYLGTVHRLDRPVSGLIVWAKTEKAARRLSSTFAGRKAVKEYWALVAPAETGQVPEPGVSGTWEDWLSPHSDPSGVVHVQTPDTPGARQAVTRFERPAPRPGLTLPDGLVWLRLWPETGRTHQLRAQSAARGLPVVGDAPYGSTRPFPAGVALHARSLKLPHPTVGNTLRLTAPLPESWVSQGVVLPPEV